MLDRLSKIYKYKLSLDQEYFLFWMNGADSDEIKLNDKLLK